MDTNKLYYVLFLSITVICNIYLQYFYFCNIQYFSPVLNFLCIDFIYIYLDDVALKRYAFSLARRHYL